MGSRGEDEGGDNKKDEDESADFNHMYYYSEEDIPPPPPASRKRKLELDISVAARSSRIKRLKDSIKQLEGKTETMVQELMSMRGITERMKADLRDLEETLI